jgi:glycerol kinase
VQQDAAEIWQSVLDCLNKLGDAASQGAQAADAEVAGITLSNQRESAVAWLASTGEPIAPMLGWQDRRTQPAADAIVTADQQRIRSISGLPLDPMFSALKFAWLLNHVEGAHELAERGEVLLGTVDSYLRYRLTGEHVVEVGNASRTQLLDVATGDWSSELLALFGVPLAALPRVVGSSHLGSPISAQAVHPAVRGRSILAVLADSHAALFAQGLNGSAGETVVKATLGTGSSIMALVSAGEAMGATSSAERNGLVATIAWGSEMPQGAGTQIVSALEGNILSSGSTVVWLAETFGKAPNDLAALAPKADFSAEAAVNLVPSFGGLGAPWWQPARGAVIEGMSLATGLPELARAAFESIALQINDLLDAVDATKGTRTTRVYLDGGPASNDWLLQLLADIAQREVVRSQNASLSTVGSAVFGATAHGVWAPPTRLHTHKFAPKLAADQAKIRIASWHAAVRRALSER